MKISKSILITAILTPVLIYFLGPSLLHACGLSVPVIATIVFIGTLSTLFAAVFAYVRYTNKSS
jgi:hypothetical protein